MKNNANNNEILTKLKRWIIPFLNPLQFIRAFPGYVGFFCDWSKYSKLKGAEKIKIIDAYPCIHDKTETTTTFDEHYFYQNIWAFKKIYGSKAERHVDVGSLVIFVGLLTAIVKVIFIDIRPLVVDLENFESRRGSILAMPFADNSVASLSCLHVAEHIGLGRYGDPFDPIGTEKACEELSRIIAVGGNLYFSCPVGKPRLCFNAHRIHSPKQIIEYFKNLKLVEFSGIDDAGDFKKNIALPDLATADYACGLFHFTKIYCN